MYPFTTDLGSLKVTQIAPAINHVAPVWGLKTGFVSEDGLKFISFGIADKIAMRILKTSTRNN